MKALNVIYLMFFVVTLFGQEEKQDEPIFELKKPFDFKGVFCDSLATAKLNPAEISPEKINKWANTDIVLEWLKFEELKASESNIDYHYLRLIYVAFNKCDEFRNYYHYLYDEDNVGNEEIEKQHGVFTKELYVLNRRGFRVMPPGYKLFEKMEVYKKNLDRYDWVMMMNSSYLGDNKYRVAYYLFNPDGPSKPMDLDNKLMEIELVLDEGVFTNFSYTEYPENLKKAATYMHRTFGTPPPPPPIPTNKN